MASNFNEMNERGKLGEAVVASLLLSLGYEVEDVSGNEAYQKQDIDFVVNGNITVEVKTDFQISKTQNLLFEDVFFKEYGDVQGWMHYCTADYICFYDVESGKMYWIDGKVMREVVPKRSEYRVYNSPGDGCKKGCYLMDLATAVSIKTPNRFVVGRSKAFLWELF